MCIRDRDKGEKENMLKESVYLQTGSFQNVDDADNQKTKLALMGVEASVQQVMLQDRVWYRVRLGPFRKMDEVNNMRSDLAKQGIEAVSYTHLDVYKRQHRMPIRATTCAKWPRR